MGAKYGIFLFDENCLLCPDLETKTVMVQLKTKAIPDTYANGIIIIDNLIFFKNHLIGKLKEHVIYLSPRPGGYKSHIRFENIRIVDYMYDQIRDVLNEKKMVERAIKRGEEIEAKFLGK
jgi:hypothetical protein